MGKSAYNFFVAEKRNQVKEEHPEWKFGEISKEVGRMWKEISEEEKKKYEEMASSAKEEDKSSTKEKKTKKCKKNKKDSE